MEYTGQRLDADSGLMYYGARYYDPQLSLFVSADPTTPDLSNPLDYNKYLYTRDNPLRFVDSSGYSPEDYYVFVEGCEGLVQSTSHLDCSTHDWGEYSDYLHQQYRGWQRQYAHYGEELPSWEAWAYGPHGNDGHLRFVVARDFQAVQGAKAIADTLASIPQDGGHIHLLGHSAGATAIENYFLNAYLQENGYVGYPSIKLDRRITDAVLVDGFTLDNPAGLGKWLKGKGINVMAVDTPYDYSWTNNDPIDDIKNVNNPHYPGECDQRGCTPRPTRPDEGDTADIRTLWHFWTSTHIADETRQFLDKAWR